MHGPDDALSVLTAVLHIAGLALALALVWIILVLVSSSCAVQAGHPDRHFPGQYSLSAGETSVTVSESHRFALNICCPLGT